MLAYSHQPPLATNWAVGEGKRRCRRPKRRRATPPAVCRTTRQSMGAWVHGVAGVGGGLVLAVGQ